MKNKNILITGTTNGIGYALATQLVKKSANLICINRNSDKADQFHEDLDTSNIACLDLISDLATLNESNCQELVDEILKDFDEIHGIVLNAGILGPLKPLQDVNEEEWKKIFDVNVHANFLLLKHLVPLISLNAKAKIILLSSGVGYEGRAYWGAYSASKFALNGLAEILADELSTHKNIQVISFNPGATNTAMRTQAFPSEDPSSISSTESVAKDILKLLDEDFDAPKLHLSRSDI